MGHAVHATLKNRKETSITLNMDPRYLNAHVGMCVCVYVRVCNKVSTTRGRNVSEKKAHTYNINIILQLKVHVRTVQVFVHK